MYSLASILDTSQRRKKPNQIEKIIMLKLNKLFFLSSFSVVFSMTHAQAQAPRPLGTMDQLINSGYIYMNDLNTPLMHHIKTGEPYNLQHLAKGEMGPGDFFISDDQIRKKAASRNEFERMDVAAQWSNAIRGVVGRLQNAKGYIIPLQTSWKEYSFSNHRYSAFFKMNKSGFRSKSSFHCMGAYDQAKNGDFLTSCVTATNLNAGDEWLQHFQIDDLDLARDIKSNGYKYSVFALAVDNGKYQVNSGNEMRYMPLETYRVTGFQPVKIVNLILVEPGNNWNVYAFTRPMTDAFTSSGNVPNNKTIDNRNGQDNNSQSTLNKSVNFVKFMSDPDGDFYADEGGVQREGDIVVIREMQDFKKVGLNNIWSRIGTYSYNCAQRTWRRLGLKSYAERMGQGNILQESAIVSEPFFAERGTTAEIALNNACTLK